jgi:small conductance mechanosensitive channel
MMETIQEILNFSVGKLTVGNIISALVIFLVCHAVIKALMGPIERLLDKLNVDLTLRGFLRTVIRVVLNFVAVCIVAESIGIPIASLLAVLGMLGLAVSLSVQGALSNLSNGIMLLITKPFKAGDYIAAAGIEGTVKEISMLCTKIITVDNKDIFVPNSEIAGGKITNFSSEPVRRVDIVIRAGYNNDIATVKKALTEAVAATDKTLNDPAPFIRLSGYKEYAVEYTIRVWVQGSDYWNVYFDLLENISKAYAANGVKGAVPGMNIYMQEDK